jgi:single-stranded DNA-binding protein
MNTLILTGRLTHKPVLKQGENTSYTRLRVAVRNRFSKDDEPTYLSVAAFGKLAELCDEHLVKGQQVEIRGRVSSREVTLEDGATIEVPTLIADDIEFGMKPRRSSEEE